MWDREKRGSLAWVDLASVIFILAVATFGYIKYRSVAGHLAAAQECWQEIESAACSLGLEPQADSASFPETLQAIEELLRRAERELLALKGELGPLLPLVGKLAWLPVTGGDLAAVPHLLEIALSAAEAGRYVCRGARPLAEELAGIESVKVDRGLLSALKEGQEDFEEAQESVERVLSERAAINRAPLSSSLGRYVDLLDERFPLFVDGLRAARLAPDLASGFLGLEGPRTYLLLVQNNHELRATGGFISLVGLVHFSEGQLTTTGFRDSYFFDSFAPAQRVPPPALSWYMWAGKWLLRDANWSPDFPTSAQVALELYQAGQEVALDGVIAFDLAAMQRIVEAIGPLHLEGYEVEITGENVIEEIKRRWVSPLRGQEVDVEKWLHRKDFMADLAKEALRKVKDGLKLGQTLALLHALTRSLDEKHMLIYLEDPALQRILAEQNWDGAIRQAPGDFLLVVDTNMGFNKVDPKVERKIEYKVTLKEDGRSKAELRLTYRNTSKKKIDRCIQEARYLVSYEEMMNGCYWDYLRACVPSGSSLTWASEIPLPEGSLPRRLGGAGPGDGSPIIGPAERGKEVFSHFFVVAPGEEIEVNFTYDLPLFLGLKPQAFSEGRYLLLVQKQPGTSNVPFRLTVRLPPGRKVSKAKPPPTWVKGDSLGYETNLAGDLSFEVRWK